MGTRQAGGVLHGLTRMVAADAAGLTDNQLLRRFAATRDDGAFTALIQRHGPLVYGVCRNVLRQEQDAEDAFQATFLVLAKRAGAIREGLALGGWLYRVAYRVATKARLAADRRRRREARVPAPEEDRPVGDLAWRELQAMLDEELNRLPEKYRAPFVLCVLGGKSKPEAAAALGWKEGTVSSRLAQAREKLRARLFRRGVTLSAVLSGLAISEHGAATAVPAALVESTRRSAVAFALGQAVAEAPAALARAVLRGMSLARLRHVGVVLAMIGVAATVAVAARPHHPPAEDPPAAPPPPVVAAAPAPEKQPGAAAAPPADAMTFFGEVKTAAGQPAPKARVMVAVEYRPPPVRDVGNPARVYKLLGDGLADETGAFQLSVPPTDTQKLLRMNIMAKAPGYAFTSLYADLDFRDRFRLKLSQPLVLVPAEPARARLLDPDGEPARGVTVHVLGLRRAAVPSFEALYFEPPVPLPGWPGPFVTDDDGTFAVPDVIPGTVVICQTRDHRYANQWVQFTARANDKAAPPAVTLTRSRVLTGQIVSEDTGLPMANATVVADTSRSGMNLLSHAEARTDADGKYVLKPFPGTDMKVTVYPPAGTPYLVVARDLRWPAADTSHQMDLAIPRGVVVRGTVTEEGTGRPVAGAAVDYEWADRYKAKAPRAAAQVAVRTTVTGPDGAFAMTVPAGSGHVVVKAADPDYLHTEIALGALKGYGKGGRPAFPDALATLRLAPGAEPQDVPLKLRRGVTVRGRVVAADGAPVRQAYLYATHYIPRGIEPGEARSGVLVQDGKFELPGCEPGAKVPVWVYDKRFRQAAMAELTADPGKEPEIRLAPTVAARVRIVDQSGLPVEKPELIFLLVQRPGADPNESQQTGARAMVTIGARLVQETEDDVVVDRMNNVTLPGLIPGATYTFVPHSGYNWGKRQTFTAPKTGTLDLGRVTLQVR